MPQPENPTAATDRFVCRREGHKPALVFTKFTASGVEPPTTYMTTCVVCGKWAEFDVPKDEGAERHRNEGCECDRRGLGPDDECIYAEPCPADRRES